MGVRSHPVRYQAGRRVTDNSFTCVFIRWDSAWCSKLGKNYHKLDHSYLAGVKTTTDLSCFGNSRVFLCPGAHIPLRARPDFGYHSQQRLARSMGSGDDMFRIWSGPEGSSHKEPLPGTRSHRAHGALLLFGPPPARSPTPRQAPSPQAPSRSLAFPNPANVAQIVWRKLYAPVACRWTIMAFRPVKHRLEPYARTL